MPDKKDIDNKISPHQLDKTLGGKINVPVFQKNIKAGPEIPILANRILLGDRAALAQGITLIESKKSEDHSLAHQLIELCLPHTKSSVRIGISGSPGVGKSTFIESLGLQYIKEGRKLAVLAIDPSSSIAGGSILGDKTRMQRLSIEENAFIRPSPAGKTLGGVARNTREAIMLCEAAGYNTILIETVGVGQSEYIVESMTDLFVLLIQPGAGDELQGIKRGVVEMADLVIVNKADGDSLSLAKQAKLAYTQALHLFPPKESGALVKVLLCSSVEETGLEEIKEELARLEKHNLTSSFFNTKRSKQQLYWFEESLKNELLDRFFQHPLVKAKKIALEKDIIDNNKSPFSAAESLLKIFFKDIEA
ncbi:MAG TPA: methylmalonyl Co-A mutase-associated GTPase MeaB [Saprospiraceae bacterium]|nr:methylmalonyl Co-A mutase-associated GTPase MeaB [Saprospiraceae bacterium]